MRQTVVWGIFCATKYYYLLYTVSMREFERKRSMRVVLSSPLILILLGIILFLTARGAWNIYLKDRASNTELRLAEERLARLQSRQTTLISATQKFSTESGIESEIRDRFQMAKPGEREIVIVESELEQDLSVNPSRSFLEKIVDFFT